MLQILLTQGKFALVDDEDYNELVKYNWFVLICGRVRKVFYAVRNVWENGSSKKILMHRQIMSTPAGLVVDHRDFNGLNNQRYNLRNCSFLDNTRNHRKYRTGGFTSEYIGVCWVGGRRKKWQAQIMSNTKYVWLGYFDNEIDAAKAYDIAALKYFGEFANLNFPEVSSAVGIEV